MQLAILEEGMHLEVVACPSGLTAVGPQIKFTFDVISANRDDVWVLPDDYLFEQP